MWTLEQKSLEKTIILKWDCINRSYICSDIPTVTKSLTWRDNKSLTLPLIVSLWDFFASPGFFVTEQHLWWSKCFSNSLEQKKQPEGVNTQSGKWNQMTHWKYFRTFNSRFHCRCYVLFLSFLWCFCLPPSLQDQTVFGLSNYGTVLLCFDGFYICCNFAKSISNEPADRLTGDKTSRIFWQDKKIIR